MPHMLMLLILGLLRGLEAPVMTPNDVIFLCYSLQAPHTPIASRLRPANQHIRSFSPLNPHTPPPPSMPPPCMPHQTPTGPGPSSLEALAGSSPDVRPAFEYTSKKDLKKVNDT